MMISANVRGKVKMKQFNLTILQLVLPLASMSKAEYKQAYGIDLDDIEIEKVTLVQEEGSKNKYFVDEIKETEEGFDIYAGGKILSIGSDVSVINNAYSVENAKPIYCHPITMGYKDASHEFTLTCLIFNNDGTPFTFASFNEWLDALIAQITTARIMCSGYVIVGGETLPVSYLNYTTDNVGIIVSPGSVSSINDNFTPNQWKALVMTSFNDGVNKIN